MGNPLDLVVSGRSGGKGQYRLKSRVVADDREKRVMFGKEERGGGRLAPTILKPGAMISQTKAA